MKHSTAIARKIEIISAMDIELATVHRTEHNFIIHALERIDNSMIIINHRSGRDVPENHLAYLHSSQP